MAKRVEKRKEYVGSTVEVIEKIKSSLENSPIKFGLFAFSETHFRMAFSDFHKVILSVALGCKKLVIAAPRGHGKTTCLSFLLLIYWIMFKKKRHIVILQSTLDKATSSLSTVKYEVLNNELIRVFGIEVVKDTQDEAIFEHVDGFQTRIICKGYEQMGKIRGEKFIAWRPDAVLVDDLEDDKTVQNPDLRVECERIFNDAVDPAIDYQSGGQLIFIGTIIHDDCLIAKLISSNKYLEFKKYRFQARNTDNSGKNFALWPQKYSLEDLRRIEKDDPIKFAKEYQNDPISGTRKQFHEEDFRRWTIIDGYVVLYNNDGTAMSSYLLTDCCAAIGCDLAWSEKKEADKTFIIPGLLTPNDEVLLDNYVAKKGMRPDEFENILFNMVAKYERMTGGMVEVGFEKAILEKVIKWLLGKAMRDRKKYLILKDIKWDKDKISRIVTTLQPRYVNHTIFHRSGYGEYEHQLLRIPSGVHDDGPDAAHMVVKLLKYPKKGKTHKPEETEFEWLMDSLRKRNKNKSFIFGQKSNRIIFPFKTKQSFR